MLLSLFKENRQHKVYFLVHSTNPVNGGKNLMLLMFIETRNFTRREESKEWILETKRRFHCALPQKQIQKEKPYLQGMEKVQHDNQGLDKTQ
jgi:hypothetical protein